LVRIGFLQSLNYPFVVQNSVTVAQIFEVLPIAGAYALQVNESDITVRSLEPYAVSEYTATSALVFIPVDDVNDLQLQILAINSRLYSQNDPTAQQLVDLIDTTIPLLTDGSSSATTDSNGGVAGSGSAGLSNQGAIGGSLDNSQSQDTTSSPSLSGKQAAIGIGAAVAAILYAALMFLGARKFRKQSSQAQLNRHHHSRVSSITGERPISPPFTQSFRSSGSSGGRGVRGQNISAPLMTENTLLL
jgi:signaling mucin MSB2